MTSIALASLALLIVTAAIGTLFAIALCRVASMPTPTPRQRYVKLRFIGVQTVPSHMKPMPLFNVVEGDYTKGSTITLKTAFRQGLRVEVVDENYQ